MERIGLSMIVWNEGHIVGRAINSIKDFIDYYCIVIDTRTDDDTEKECLRHLEGIPGEIIYREFTIDDNGFPLPDFAGQRNAALDPLRGKVEWAFILDADEVFVNEGFTKDALKADIWGFTNNCLYAEATFPSIRLINIRYPWNWRDNIHNFLECAGLPGCQYSTIFYVHHIHDGNRSMLPNKIKNDIEVLSHLTKKYPDNPRYWFYYAQTLREDGQLDLSVEAYKRRIDTPSNFDEETWYCKLKICDIYCQKHDFDNAVSYGLKCYQERPNRSEPLYYIAMMLRDMKWWNLGYVMTKLGITIPMPVMEALFIDKMVYDYAMKFEHAVMSYYKGYYEEAFNFNNQVLKHPDILPHYKEQTIKNQGYVVEELKRKGINIELPEITIPAYYLIDHNFSYSKQDFGFISATHGVDQKDINWLRVENLNDINKNDIPIVITDFAISKELFDKLQYLQNKKYIWLLEPRVRKPEIYNLVKEINKQFKIDSIFTFDKHLLEACPNAILTQPGGCWVDSKASKLIEGTHEKINFMSIVTTHKSDCELHKQKIELVKYIKNYYSNVIDVYGEGEWTDPANYLHDYKYTIVIENNIEDGYFTEKLINALAVGTIPIYYGAPDIDQYFNTEGIIILKSLSELDKVMEMLNNSPYYYEERYQSIKENRQLANRYKTRERILARKIAGYKWDNPFKFFDQVYYLTLINKNLRLQNSINNLNTIGYGLLWDAIEHEQGGLGCKLSYRSIIQDAKNKGYKNIMVIEDDVSFVKDYRFVLTEVCETLSEIEYDHVKILGTPKGESTLITPYLHNIRHVTGMPVVAFNERIYDKILDSISSDPNQSFTQYTDSIDRWIWENIAVNGNTYIVSKEIVALKEYKSEIEATTSRFVQNIIHDNYKKFVSKKIIYFNDVMSTFGNGYMNNYNFIRIPFELADLDGILWFGIYNEEEFNKVIYSSQNINLHWCGSDVLWCIGQPEKMDKLAKKKNIYHTCENDLQQKELASVGINAVIAPMYSSPLEDNYKQVDKEFDVLCYTPDRKELYNVPLMIEIAKDCPDLMFAFIGDHANLTDVPFNVTNFGWVDQAKVQEVINKSKIYLRITEHDAFADLTVKSLLSGIHVITNYDYPGVNFVKKDKLLIITEINKLLNVEPDKIIRTFYLNSGYLNNWDKILRHDINEF